MPMKTVGNRLNRVPLGHVEVIVEPQNTHALNTPGHPQRYPAFMANAAGLLCRALETFFIKARNPSEKLAIKMIDRYKMDISFWAKK